MTSKSLLIRFLKQVGIYDWQRRVRRIPLSIRLCNFIAQRILRLNGNCEWQVHFTSRVSHEKRIQLGESAKLFMALSGGCYFNGQGGIEIGEGTIFAPGVKLISADHEQCDFSKHVSRGPIRIGRNCWLGADVIVLSGVNLGDHVVVAAGSVVTREFGSDLLIGGTPARVLKELPTYAHATYAHAERAITEATEEG